ncbi:hypothetical protein BTVI_90034 [Pitangus sulphuratus]|nr:hypothetical protein BTVI_90034 [Pitangus sulphuratus]
MAQPLLGREHQGITLRGSAELVAEFFCAFDLLIYTDKDLAVPEKWEESGPQFITNSEEVRLRSFTTTIHKVNTMVAYKRDSVP